MLPHAKLAGARLVPVVEIVALSLSLVEAFGRTTDPYQHWAKLLRFSVTVDAHGEPNDKGVTMSTEFPQTMHRRVSDHHR
jgi:hypothetical protein